MLQVLILELLKNRAEVVAATSINSSMILKCAATLALDYSSLYFTYFMFAGRELETP